MQASPFSYHDLHINYTKTIKNQKPFQNQNFNSHKLCIHTITLYKWRCFSRSQTSPYILTKRKLIKKLPKIYTPHGSPNNQKETKSHGSPCDCTIIKRKQNHMVPHVIAQIIKRKHHMVPDAIAQIIKRKQHHMILDVIAQIIKRKQHNMILDVIAQLSQGNNITWFSMWLHN